MICRKFVASLVTALALSSLSLSAATDYSLDLSGVTTALDTGVNINQDFTIEFLAKPTSLTGDWGLNVYTGTGGSDMRFQVKADGSGRLITYDEDKNDANVPAGTFTVGTWAHVALVHEGNGVDMKIYIDGQLASESGDEAPNFASNWGTVKIGGYNGNAFNGLIDDLRIWNDARTAGEIFANKDREVTTLSTSDNLSAWFRLNEGAGDTVGDINHTLDRYMLIPANSAISALGASPAGTAGNGLNLATGDTLSTGYDLPAIFTVAFWVKTPATLSNDCVKLLTDNGGGNEVNFAINADGSAKYYTWDDADNRVTLPAGSFTAGTWYHIAFTHLGNGNGMELFVNGSSVGTAVTNFERSPWGRLKLQNFGTLLDQLRIWNTALDETAIATEKAATTPQAAGLQLAFGFDDSIGSTTTVFTDSSVADHTFNSPFTLVWSSDVLTPVLGLDLRVENGQLVWSAQQELGVSKYVVEQWINGQWVMIQTLNAGAGGYAVAIDETLPVRLMTIDASGFVQVFNAAVNELTLTIHEGWNLLSLPFAMDAVTELEAMTGSELWVWDGQNYQVADRLAAQQGFWVNSQYAGTFTVTGETDTLGLVELQAGWNLAGPVNNMNVPENLLIYGHGEAYETLQTSGILVVGRGYWIHTESEQTIELK